MAKLLAAHELTAMGADAGLVIAGQIEQIDKLIYKIRLDLIYGWVDNLTTKYGWIYIKETQND
jgi:hypothetical protein